MIHKDAWKNNSKAMELILKGLTDSMKKRIGKYSIAKELWFSLEQLCSTGDTKDNSHPAKKTSLEYYGSNDDTTSKYSSEIDHCNHEDDEEEEGVDLGATLDAKRKFKMMKTKM